VIVGSPRGLEGTITAGILSSVRDSGEGFKVLQTDAAVNPGNSGGPLVNNRGQVIGVVSFVLRSSQGLNFAVPINYVRGMLNSLHEPISLSQMRRSFVAPASVDQPNQSTPKEALDWSSERMLLACKDVLESKSDEHGNLVFPLNFNTGQCWGTFSLLWSFGSTTSVDTGEALVPGTCVPKGATVARIIAVFSDYVKRHPELYSEDASPVALKAIWEAFPCKAAPVGRASVNKQVNGPSLKDTLDWLREKIPLATVNYTDKGISYNQQVTVFSLDSCIGVFDVATTGKVLDRPHEGYVGVSRYTVPLGGLTESFVAHMENLDFVDADHRVVHRPYVGGERWSYRVYLTSKSNDIRVASFPSSPWPATSDPTLQRPVITIKDNLDLRFNDEAIANRVLEAVKHATNFCGGKEAF
jgi:Trypsin-like peptidase domain/Rap1a immunity proteins